MSIVKPWAWTVTCCAALAIAGYYLADGQVLHWIFKPLTTLLILAMAWSLRPIGRYRRWIMIGLLLSTLGDVFLMLPGDYFVQGLLSFLIAHGAYLWAFGTRAAWGARALPLLCYAGVGASVLGLLWSGIPSALRVPVLVYVVALCAMAAQATVIWRIQRDWASACAALGGALFVFSDSIIAINRFVAPFEYSKAVILISYWMAQWLIARSIYRQDAVN